MSREILHEGVVQTAGLNSVTVLLSPGVSCVGCHAEKSCNISGNDRKTVVINGSYQLSPGEKVTVSMKASQGFSALILGYIIPFLLVFISLVVLLSLSLNELLSGLVSLGLLLPYYGILFILRKGIDRRFTFTLNRLQVR